MNMQHSLTWKFMLDNNTEERARNICCTKGEGRVDRSTVRFKKFQSGCKKLDDQVRSGWPKSRDSETVQ